MALLGLDIQSLHITCTSTGSYISLPRSLLNGFLSVVVGSSLRNDRRPVGRLGPSPSS